MTKLQIPFHFAFMNILSFPFLSYLIPNTQTELGTSTLLSPFSDKHVNTVLQLYNSTNQVLHSVHSCTVQEYSFSLYSEAGPE